MNANYLTLIFGLAFGISVFVAIYVFTSITEVIPTDDRQYMDKLPPILRLVWPLVRVIEFHLCRLLPLRYLEKVNNKLNNSGVAYLVTAEQFCGLQLISLITFCILSSFLSNATGNESSLSMLLGAGLGYFYPQIWLSDRRKKRYLAVQKGMPMFLDFITMAVEAGLNLTGALNQVVQKGPPGPLRQEFFMVVRDLRSGLPRADALRRMDERLVMPEITSFVGTVIQSEKMGASLGNALRSQAEQRRTERFQRAEKQAMEAPVKLIGPLMMFIFPVTFIVIGFPIVMKFLASGLV